MKKGLKASSKAVAWILAWHGEDKWGGIGLGPGGPQITTLQYNTQYLCQDILLGKDGLKIFEIKIELVSWCVTITTGKLYENKWQQCGLKQWQVWQVKLLKVRSFGNERHGTIYYIQYILPVITICSSSSLKKKNSPGNTDHMQV